MSRFGWMQRFRSSWRGPEWWTVALIESNGWHTPVSDPFLASPRKMSNRTTWPTGTYAILPVKELQRINKRVAMVEWSAQSSRTVDMSDHDEALSIARWAGATSVGPDDGYPEGVVMILNGMHIRDGDTIVRADGRTVVLRDH